MLVENGFRWRHLQAKKITTFKEKVNLITRGNSLVNLEKVIEDVIPVLRGCELLPNGHLQSFFCGIDEFDSTSATR